LRFFDWARTDARNPNEYDSLLRDPRFQEYLELRYLAERDIARRYRELLGRSEWIAARIKTQLD
jgi:hypothetical protein